jgi:hypothetical protein
MSSATEKPWHDVPDANLRAWGDAFDLSVLTANPPSPCPVCGAHALHLWYWLNRRLETTSAGLDWQGDGSGWQWCSHCRCYQHFRALVPAWWKPAYDVPKELLRHDPEAIEQARLSPIQRD